MPLLDNSFNGGISRPNHNLQKVAGLRLPDLCDIMILMRRIRFMEVRKQGKQKNRFDGIFLSVCTEDDLQ